MAMRRSTILDHNGNAIALKMLDEEVARPSVTGIRQVWHSSVADNLGPQRLASILRSAAEGDAYDYLTLAEEMEERDPHYASVLSTRKLALAALDMRVDSYSDDARDVEIADALREVIGGPEFREAVFHLADALGKGYSVAELIWDRSSTPWVPARIEHRDPRFFRFDRDTGREIRLLTEQEPAFGEPLQPAKFIVHMPRLRSGLPVRGGLARLAAVGYMCKAWTWRDWMAFADIYGLPMRVGRYGPGVSNEDIRKLIAAVSSLGSDAAAVLPDSTRIEFEQAANVAGSADFFERLADWWDRQVSKAVLGQTMTTDDGASLSQAQVHNEVRIDLLKADAMSLDITLNRYLIRPFVDLNFGPGRYPKLVTVVPEPEDLQLLVNSLEKLVPMGLRVEESVMRDKLGLPDPGDSLDVRLLQVPAQIANAMSPIVQRPVEQASNREQRRPDEPDREDQLVTLLSQYADPVIDGWVGRMRQHLEESESLEDFRDRLLDLLPELSTSELAKAMQHALAVAHVAGMADALDDSRA